MAVHNQNPSQTQAVAFPTNRAFVLQFQGAEPGQATPIAGRVEHLTSGHRARFQTWEELQRFVEQELAQIEKASTDPTAAEL